MTLTELATAALADAETWEDSIAGLEASYERMHKREPLLAAGVLDLTRQLAEARAALKDACAIIEGLVPRPRHSGESVATANSLRKRGGL